MTSIDLDQPLITPPSMARSNPNSKSDSSQKTIPIPAPVFGGNASEYLESRMKPHTDSSTTSGTQSAINTSSATNSSSTDDSTLPGAYPRDPQEALDHLSDSAPQKVYSAQSSQGTTQGTTFDAMRDQLPSKESVMHVFDKATSYLPIGAGAIGATILGTTVASNTKNSSDLEKNINNSGSTDQSLDPGLASRMGVSRNGPSDSTASKTSKSLFDQNSFAVGGVVSNLKSGSKSQGVGGSPSTHSGMATPLASLSNSVGAYGTLDENKMDSSSQHIDSTEMAIAASKRTAPDVSNRKAVSSGTDSTTSKGVSDSSQQFGSKAPTLLAAGVLKKSPGSGSEQKRLQQNESAYKTLYQGYASVPVSKDFQGIPKETPQSSGFGSIRGPSDLQSPNQRGLDSRSRGSDVRSGDSTSLGGIGMIGSRGNQTQSSGAPRGTDAAFEDQSAYYNEPYGRQAGFNSRAAGTEFPSDTKDKLGQSNKDKSNIAIPAVLGGAAAAAYGYESQRAKAPRDVQSSKFSGTSEPKSSTYDSKNLDDSNGEYTYKNYPEGDSSTNKSIIGGVPSTDCSQPRVLGGQDSQGIPSDSFDDSSTTQPEQIFGNQNQTRSGPTAILAGMGSTGKSESKTPAGSYQQSDSSVPGQASSRDISSGAPYSQPAGVDRGLDDQFGTSDASSKPSAFVAGGGTFGQHDTSGRLSSKDLDSSGTPVDQGTAGSKGFQSGTGAGFDDSSTAQQRQYQEAPGDVTSKDQSRPGPTTLLAGGGILGSRTQGAKPVSGTDSDFPLHDTDDISGSSPSDDFTSSKTGSGAGFATSKDASDATLTSKEAGTDQGATRKAHSAIPGLIGSVIGVGGAATLGGLLSKRQPASTTNTDSKDASGVSSSKDTSSQFKESNQKSGDGSTGGLFGSKQDKQTSTIDDQPTYIDYPSSTGQQTGGISDSNDSTSRGGAALLAGGGTLGAASQRSDKQRSGFNEDTTGFSPSQDTSEFKDSTTMTGVDSGADSSGNFQDSQVRSTGDEYTYKDYPSSDQQTFGQSEDSKSRNDTALLAGGTGLGAAGIASQQRGAKRTGGDNDYSLHNKQSGRGAIASDDTQSRDPSGFGSASDYTSDYPSSGVDYTKSSAHPTDDTSAFGVGDKGFSDTTDAYGKVDIIGDDSGAKKGHSALPAIAGVGGATALGGYLYNRSSDKPTDMSSKDATGYSSGVTSPQFKEPSSMSGGGTYDDKMFDTTKNKQFDTNEGQFDAGNIKQFDTSGDQYTYQNYPSTDQQIADDSKGSKSQVGTGLLAGGGALGAAGIASRKSGTQRSDTGNKYPMPGSTSDRGMDSSFDKSSSDKFSKEPSGLSSSKDPSGFTPSKGTSSKFGDPVLMAGRGGTNDSSRLGQDQQFSSARDQPTYGDYPSSDQQIDEKPKDSKSHTGAALLAGGGALGTAGVASQMRDDKRAAGRDITDSSGISSAKKPSSQFKDPTLMAGGTGATTDDDPFGSRQINQANIDQDEPTYKNYPTSSSQHDQILEQPKESKSHSGAALLAGGGALGAGAAGLASQGKGSQRSGVDSGTPSSGIDPTKVSVHTADNDVPMKVAGADESTDSDVLSGKRDSGYHEPETKKTHSAIPGLVGSVIGVGGAVALGGLLSKKSPVELSKDTATKDSTHDATGSNVGTTAAAGAAGAGVGAGVAGATAGGNKGSLMKETTIYDPNDPSVHYSTTQQVDRSRYHGTEGLQEKYAGGALRSSFNEERDENIVGAGGSRTSGGYTTTGHHTQGGEIKRESTLKKLVGKVKDKVMSHHTHHA